MLQTFFVPSIISMWSYTLVLFVEASTRYACNYSSGSSNNYGQALMVVLDHVSNLSMNLSTKGFFRVKRYPLTLLLVILWSLPVYSQAPPASKVTKQVALTFDDLPATQGEASIVLPKLIKTLTHHHIPAIGFVNEAKLYQASQLLPAPVQLLQHWLGNGLALGNHTFSHIAIDQATLEEYQADILKGEKLTKTLLAEQGQIIRYFRHPQLRTGPTLAYKQGLAKFLKAKGYKVAPVTIDNDEYVFARLYFLAKTRRDSVTMHQIARAYIPYMESMFAFYEQLSQACVGYQVRQILLLHANELNADYLEELIAMMQRRHYRFISLEEALQDKAYQLPEAQSVKGYSWIQRWMLAKGQPLQEHPSIPNWLKALQQTYSNP